MTETNNRSKFDKLLWALVVVLICTGVFLNHYLTELTGALRFFGWFLLSSISLGIIYKTTQGKELWGFMKEAKVELYKVIWPTRDETVKITIMIVAMVVVMSLIMWGMDSILLKTVGWLMKV